MVQDISSFAPGVDAVALEAYPSVLEIDVAAQKAYLFALATHHEA